MRFKFRAFYKCTKTMVVSEKLESINFETKTVGAYIDQGEKGFYRLRLSDFEVMQWTGLQDKNGVDIYEGDILVTSNDDNDYDIWSKEDFGKTAVLWDAMESCFRGSTWTWYSGNGSESVYDIQFIEVIGNIYENPELIGRTATESTAILSESEAE